MTSKKTAFDLDPNLNGDPSGADAFTLAATEALVASNADLEVAAQKFQLLATFPEFFPHLDRELDAERNLALILQLPEKREAIVRHWYEQDQFGSSAEIRDHSVKTPEDQEKEIKTFDLAKYHLSESGCWYDIETGEIMGYRGPNDEFLPEGVKAGELYSFINQITSQPIQEFEEFRLDTEDKVKWALKRLLRIETRLKALDIEQQMVLDNIERQRKKLTNERVGFMWKFKYDFEQYYNHAITLVAKGKSINLTYGVLKKSIKPASTKINQHQSSEAVLYIESRIEELKTILRLHKAKSKGKSINLTYGVLDSYEQEAVNEALADYESALKVEKSVLVSKIPDVDKALGLLPSEIFNFTDKREEFSVEVKVTDAPTVAVIPE